MRDSDYILLHAPYTKDNYHIINSDSLQLCKKKPYIINTGRGELIDSDALYDAITKGIVTGAGLDVLKGGASIQKGNKILSAKNVLLTPHLGWYSEQSLVKLQTEAALSIRDALEGKCPRNCVNKEIYME